MYLCVCVVCFLCWVFYLYGFAYNFILSIYVFIYVSWVSVCGLCMFVFSLLWYFFFFYFHLSAVLSVIIERRTLKNGKALAYLYKYVLGYGISGLVLQLYSKHSLFSCIKHTHTYTKTEPARRTTVSSSPFLILLCFCFHLFCLSFFSFFLVLLFSFFWRKKMKLMLNLTCTAVPIMLSLV